MRSWLSWIERRFPKIHKTPKNPLFHTIKRVFYCCDSGCFGSVCAHCVRMSSIECAHFLGCKKFLGPFALRAGFCLVLADVAWSAGEPISLEQCAWLVAVGLAPSFEG